MASNWKAEILDRIQDKYFESEEHDRTVRSILIFKDSLNPHLVEQAINKLVSNVPILNSTFQENNGKYFWNARVNDFTLLFNNWKSWDPFNQDFLKYPDPHNHPQITVSLFNNTIGFRANGMLVDVFALKSIVLYFFDIYNNLSNKLFQSKYGKPHGRSAEELLKSIPFSKKAGKYLLNKISNDGFNAIKFANENNPSNAIPTVLNDGFGGPEAEMIFNLAKKYNTTVSSIFLAAYHRAIANVLKQNNTPINIARQFNVRDVSKHSDYISYNNAYTLLPSVVSVGDEKFSDTLKKVSGIQQKIEKHHLVAKNFSKHHKFYAPTEYFQFVSLGDIARNKINIEKNELQEIYFYTPERFLPYISVAIVALDQNEILLSSCNYCTENDYDNIQYFISQLKHQIQMFIWDNDNDFYLNLQGKKGKKVADKKEKKSEHTHSTKKTIKAKKGKTHKALVVSHSNSEWTADQKSLAKKYEKLTNQKLEPGTNGKIKYKIKGKNTYQQRTWAEIKKFVDYKTSKK